METTITFPGGARVDATFGAFTVHTDQPVHSGGEDSAPTPFALFLAAIGTCAGIYVVGFCKQRGLSTDGVRIVQTQDVDRTTGMVTRVRLAIHVPESFPAKYRDALVRAAEQCTVKKHLESPPAFTTETVVDAAPAHA